MTDPIHLPSEQQKSWHELREEYRASNQQRIHRMLQRRSIRARDGRTYSINVLAEPAQASYRLDDDGGTVLVGHDLDLGAVSQAMADQLHDHALEALVFDNQWSGVKLPEGAGVDRDGPPLASLCEEDLLRYTDNLIKKEQS